MRRGNLFIVSGPSGAGKGTLVKELLDRVPDVWVSVSATTRAPRPGEVEGRDYLFVAPERFEELASSGGLLEWAEVHGNRYGTPREAVEDMVAEGKQVILEIDPQGALQVKDKRPDSILIFIRPPSMDELRRRLEGRGSETPVQVELRLQAANTEMEFAGIYDFVIQNDDVSRAADELAAVIDSCSGTREL
ncbi:MAG: guanylate kinase [Coriobacteriales bacterium]|nr:guanylate kinase [Coriobacteriales bacterium]